MSDKVPVVAWRAWADDGWSEMTGWPSQAEAWKRDGRKVEDLVLATALVSQEAEIAAVTKERDRLIANPGAERYWEGRWRDAEAEIAALRAQVDAAREFAKRHPALTLIDLAEFEAFLKVPAAMAAALAKNVEG